MRVIHVGVARTLPTPTSSASSSSAPSSCSTSLWRSSWTTLTTWRGTGPSWGSTTSGSLSPSGQSTILTPRWGIMHSCTQRNLSWWAKSVRGSGFDSRKIKILAELVLWYIFNVASTTMLQSFKASVQVTLKKRQRFAPRSQNGVSIQYLAVMWPAAIVDLQQCSNWCNSCRVCPAINLSKKMWLSSWSLHILMFNFQNYLFCIEIGYCLHNLFYGSGEHTQILLKVMENHVKILHLYVFAGQNQAHWCGDTVAENIATAGLWQALSSQGSLQGMHRVACKVCTG